MKRLRFQIIMLALCLVGVLAAKSYVDKFLRLGQGSGAAAHDVPQLDERPGTGPVAASGGVMVQAPVQAR